MPQRDALLPWLSAIDNAGLALRVAGASRAAARAAAHEHFAAFGLEGFERARPAALSGGMRQRVAFLRTLLAGRPVLCLDEPFGALDALTRLQMQRWLAGALEREPRTVLLVTHDVEEAVLLADRVVLLSPRPGRIVEMLDVGLPRPRARDDRAVVELRERALRLLGADDGAFEGAARVTAALALLVAARRLGGARPARRRRPADPARADAGASRRCGRTARCSPRTSGRPAYEVVLGLAVAVVAGAALAVAMHLSPALRRALRPLVIGSQAVPVPVIAPLVILVLGFGLAPKVLLVALVCFFPITINLYDGLRAADPDARRLLRSLQATPLAGAAARRGAGRAAGRVHGPEGRCRRRRDRRRVRRVGGRRARPRPRAADRQRAARDAPARSPPPCCSSCWPSPSTAPARCSSGAWSTGPLAPDPEDHDDDCSRSCSPAP